MKKQETFNPDLLNTIIVNFDDLIEQGVFTDDSIKYTLVSYLNRSRHGNIDVYYRQKNNSGRMYAIKSLSLQNIKKCVRHTISKDYYVDIDMVNAHPVILAHICKMNNIKCPILEDYVKNRDQIIAKSKMDKDQIKKKYLIMTNSDDELDDPNMTHHMMKYEKEMKTIHTNLISIFKDEYNEHKHKDLNPIASFVNKLMCDYENKILMKMLEYFGDPNDCVLCFDGVMLPKKDYDVDGCIKHIKKIFNMDNFVLKIKPMTDEINLSKYTEGF